MPGQIAPDGLAESPTVGNGFTVITIGPKVVPQLKPLATSTVTDAPLINEELLKVLLPPVCTVVVPTLKI